MLQHLFTLLFAVGLCLSAQAQQVVQGTVSDSASGQPLGGSNVMLIRKGKTVKFARANQQGQYWLQVTAVQAGDSVQATCMGYGKRRVAVSADGVTDVLMTGEAFFLEEVQVKAVRITGRDTVSYDLTRFASDRDNTLKDVLKKLPGVEISRNGTISYNGQQLSRFTVEGLDLTNGRYNLLTENIRAQDVKRAQIVEHDQPKKALRGREVTDNVAMNIELKDEARDRYTLTLKPYLLFGDPTHAGGTATALQIGKKKQQMYEATYDRTGRDLDQYNYRFAIYGDRLQAATPPTWYSVPSLSSPIDDERLRFNTSQHYSLNRVQKQADDTEWRINAGYQRTVIHQHTSNTALYYLSSDVPTMTEEHKQLTLWSDNFTAEAAHMVNHEQSYGNEILRLKASQADGLSDLSGTTGTLIQRVRLPQLDLSASVYRLFPVGRNQLTWRSVVDYHHAVSDLCIGDDRQRLRNNLWHTNHTLSWRHTARGWTQNYGGGVELENLNVAGYNNLYLRAQLSPSWQYQREPLSLSFSVPVAFYRYTRQQQSLLTASPSAYLSWKQTNRTEWRVRASYYESVGGMSNFAIDEYQRDYRTFYQNAGLLPQTRMLSSSLAYGYKRPIYELFVNASVGYSRTWQNTTTDLRIVDGYYYTTLRKQHSHGDAVNASLSASKGFYDLNLKTSLTARYQSSWGQQLSSGRTLDYRSQVWTLKPTAEFSPSWCAVSYEGDFSLNRSRSAGVSQPTLFNWRQQLSLTSTIKNVDITYSLVHYRNELQAGNTLNTVLSDVSVVWRLKKVRLTAALHNLFDKRQYIVTTYSGVSTSTSAYDLRPREFMLSAQFSL